MKLILVGSTGFIGEAVLRAAIQEAKVTSIVALSRRALPKDLSEEAKVKTVLLEDFTKYSDEVIDSLKGANACIWSLGGRRGQFNSFEAAHVANVELLEAGAKAFAERLAPQLEDKSKFRFVFCSGTGAERDTSKKPLFMSESRLLKGEAENTLLKLEKNHAEDFEVAFARPAGVLATDTGLQNTLMGSIGIGKGQLGYAMVDIALNGAKQQTVENSGLKKIASESSKPHPNTH